LSGSVQIFLRHDCFLCWTDWI